MEAFENESLHDVFPHIEKKLNFYLSIKGDSMEECQ
jgi:hypothetical protein